MCLNFYRGVERRSSPAMGQQEAGLGAGQWKQQGQELSCDSAFYSDSRAGDQDQSTVGPSDSDREERPGPEQDRPGFDAIFTPADAEKSPRIGGVSKAKRKDVSGRKTGKGNGCDSGGGGKGSPLRNQTLTSLCILSSHPFFSNFRECLLTLKKLVDACSNSNARWRVGGGGKGRGRGRGSDSVWAVLTGEGVAADTASSFLLHDVREIETWILRLLSAPVPVSGHTRLELEIVDRRFGPLLLFAFPDQTRFR